MTFYRLYFFDQAGHIFGLRSLEAANEDQAVGRAERMGRGEIRELWLRDIMVKHWDS